MGLQNRYFGTFTSGGAANKQAELAFQLTFILFSQVLSLESNAFMHQLKQFVKKKFRVSGVELKPMFIVSIIFSFYQRCI